MKYAILLLTAAVISASAQTAQQDAIRRRATQSAAPTTKIAPSQTSAYATDPAWRIVTNQIASLEAQIKVHRSKIPAILERKNAKMNAGQPVTGELAELNKVDSAIAPLVKQVAALKVKEIEIRQRIDRQSSPK